MSARSIFARSTVGAAVAMGALLAGDPATLDKGYFVTKAEAVVGRPLTPMSYAGVARRTTRRAYYGAAAGAAAVGAAAYGASVYGGGCAQVVDAYGRVITRC